jgi:hypothetical protein
MVKKRLMAKATRMIISKACGRSLKGILFPLKFIP